MTTENTALTGPATSAEGTQPSTEVVQTGATSEGTGASEQAAETDEQREQRVRQAAQTLNEQKRARAEQNRRAAFERIQRERDEYRAIALENMRRQQQPVAPPAPADDGAPKRENFDSYEAWIEAKADYRAAKRAEESTAKFWQSLAQQAQHLQQQNEMGEVVRGHMERTAQFAQRTPDFADVVDRDDIVVPPAASEAIARMADGPAILYAIGKEPAIAEHLNRLRPTDQLVYLGQLSRAISSRPAQVSKAPPPGSPVTSRGSADADVSGMTRDQYFAHITKEWGKKPK